MTNYTLYTAKRSGAASVEVLLNALGLEVELKDATPWSEPPGPCLEELKRVNPLGQLPTLVTPGGEILTESVAILWTLLESIRANGYRRCRRAIARSACGGCSLRHRRSTRLWA